ncbi:response regulator, partial [bacterium AH-315-J21]|nr:response regulator [bacterium AH-315-J21]MBN4057074.1 response regulator [bacterium AH-315-J21]
MITQHVLALLWLSLVSLTYVRILRKRDEMEAHFRAFTFGSGFCLLVAGLIFWLGAFGSYSSWFLPVVYPILDWTRIALVIVGVALILWAFIQKFEGEEEVVPVPKSTLHTTEPNSKNIAEIPLTGLAALNTLRMAISQPYPFVELARVALDGVSGICGITCGALYIHNESTQEMTIAASKGLTPQQERILERLPLGSPILVEAIASGEPLLSSEFVTEICNRELNAEVFNSSFAVLAPLLRNNDALGLIVLIGDSAKQLSNFQLATVAQMSDIVSDKFANVKLRGELARTKKKSAEREDSRKRIAATFHHAFDALTHSSELNSVCRELVGIGSADSVALIETSGSGKEIRLRATSEHFPIMTEGFELAALQALERQSLVLLSREHKVKPSALPSGLEQVAIEREPMALVAPLTLSNRDEVHDSVAKPNDPRFGILFWNSVDRFHLAPEELQDFQEWLQPLKIALRNKLMERNAQGASGVLEIIQEILHPEDETETEKIRLKRFVASVRRVFNLSDTCLVFKRTSSGQLRPLMTFGVPFDEVSTLVILAGEGSLGRCSALNLSAIEFGEARISEVANEYDMLNREVFGEGFRRMGNVQSQVIAPISVNGACRYLLSFFFEDQVEAQICAKSLLPLCQLLSLVLSVKELQLPPEGSTPDSGFIEGSNSSVSSIVNEINNDLSTIIGNCQLAAEDPNLSGALERVLKLVIDRAEHSADRLRIESGLDIQKRAQGESAVVHSSNSLTIKAAIDSLSLAEKLRLFAAKRVIGGQMLLAEGRAREVEFELESDFTISLPANSAESLIERLCYGLSAYADEREIVTVAVYCDAGYEYLDISRRWRNLPSAKRIGSYARFESSPIDGIFDVDRETLNILHNLGVEIAFDKRSAHPAYVTLRKSMDTSFAENDSNQSVVDSTPRILAIDDQSMILDLLSAMCDSMGYAIDTFESPSRAIAAFERGAHDIVITDVAMPELDGWEVAAAIKGLRPETYLIFITGWEEGLSAERLQSHNVNQVLKKPFRLEQLTVALEDARRYSATPA